MKAREILIALWLKYDRDWDSIYAALKNKDMDDNLEEHLKDIDPDYFITILDEDYPERLKHRHKPPFVI